MQTRFLSSFFILILLFLLQGNINSKNLNAKSKPEQEIFSFTVVYLYYDNPHDMDYYDQNVTLFRTKYLGDYSIKKMVVNGVEIKKPSNRYYFEKELVYYNISFIIDISRSTQLKRMFYSIDELYYISFTEKFDTSNIESMDEMFEGCWNLKSVNLGNINTPKLKSIKGMFSMNFDLISINFGKLDTSKVETTERLFESCYDLVKIDISNLSLNNIKNMSNMFRE